MAFSLSEVPLETTLRTKISYSVSACEVAFSVTSRQARAPDQKLIKIPFSEHMLSNPIMLAHS